jgi:hypothetical protein
VHGFDLAHFSFPVMMRSALIVRFRTFELTSRSIDWIGRRGSFTCPPPLPSEHGAHHLEEWLIEIRLHELRFRLGISEWSSTWFVPPACSCFCASGHGVLSRTRCGVTPADTEPPHTAATTGTGPFLVAMTPMHTMTDVVCCATPSWVVGLAISVLACPRHSRCLRPWVGSDFFGLRTLFAVIVFLAWREVPPKD